MEHLISKEFKKDFVSTFKGDHSGNLQSRQTPDVFYSKAIPSGVAAPDLIAWSEELATELGIENPDLKDVELLAGNKVTPTMYPYAACYAGHQFGNWAGQLGDGRAITLGEWQTPQDSTVELQLKGAGPTPYSRRADGRAVLRSSLREYLMSEAMHYLGIPTTRALSLVTTGEQVMRDMFYDGHPAPEPGAIVMRVSPSFLRFGSFELLASRQQPENLKQLADWTIAGFFPHITGDGKYLNWFREVMERTASLMIEWFRVGFVHGVMNTDNMSILGLSIDYGPFSFLDEYDLNFTPNTTDLPGKRYAFGKQSEVAFWNLECLAGAISPLFESTDPLIKVLEEYQKMFEDKYLLMMASKLGLDEVRQEDLELIMRFQETLSQIQPDLTIFYQMLIDLPLDLNEVQVIRYFESSYYRELLPQETVLLTNLMKSYQTRILSNSIVREESQELMRKVNPRFILRNYLLHQAIEQLQNGDKTLFENLREAIKHPYSNHFDQFFEKRPVWAGRMAGCSMLSCSS